MSLSSLLSSVVAGSKHSSMTEDLGVATSDGESIDFAALLTEQMNGVAAGTQPVTTDTPPHTLTDARSKQQSTTSFETPPSPDSGGIFSLFETVVAQRNGLPPRTRQGDAESNAATAASVITANGTQASTYDARSDLRSVHAFEHQTPSDSSSHSSLSESTDSQYSGSWPSQSPSAPPNSGSLTENPPSLQTKLDEMPGIGTFAFPGASAASRPDQLSSADKLRVDGNAKIAASSYPSAESQAQDPRLIQDTAQLESGKTARKTAALNDRMTANETAKSAFGPVTSETQSRQAESAQGQITSRPFNGTSSSISNLATRATTPLKSPQSVETSATNNPAAPPAPAKFADLISMKGSQALAAEIPVTNDEPAKPAGDTLPPLPTNTAGPLDRTQSTARTDNPHSISTPLNDPRWSQQLGERVVWLARGDIQNAQININPAQLGPIQINISLNGDQMSANFVAAHQEVRQALEDAMPRLRDMLSGAGINLGQANVGAQTQQQQQRESFAHFGERPRSSGEDAILSPDNHTASNLLGRPVQQGKGLVDLFA